MMQSTYTVFTIEKQVNTTSSLAFFEKIKFSNKSTETNLKEKALKKPRDEVSMKN